MTAPLKLAAFAVLLLALGGGGAVAGGAIDPDRDEAAAGHGAETGDGGGHGTKAGVHPVRGLAVAGNGLRLVADDPEVRRGRWETVRFRVVEDSGETVRDFDVEHTKRMHVIVARRDLAGFQHLHPEQAEDGSWSLPLKLEDAGSYRFFADFSHAEEKATPATDLRADGAADLETIQTEPYLGAGGHLVALREGDLAFLHVHPTENGDSAGFAATFPTTGRYRLFLQFKHDGHVRTVAFTQEVS